MLSSTPDYVSSGSLVGSLSGETAPGRSERPCALTAAKLVEDHRFHDLRHTFGTAMAAAGVPMRTLQEWMGHRDLATTQRYADYAPNAHEVAMVDRAFAGAATQMEGAARSEP